MPNVRRTRYGFQFYTRVAGLLITEHFVPSALKNGREPTQREVDDWIGTQRGLASGVVVRPDEPTGPTFHEDVATYLAQIVTMPTYAWRKADLDLWIGVFGTQPRAQITSSAIRTQLEQWRAEGYAASTVNHRRTALMHLWTVLDGKSAQNPARDTPRYREPALPPRDLSAAAIDAILDAMPDGPMKARLVLMRWTGWPPQQIRTLTEAQIRWQQAVRIERHKGKGVEPQWIPLLPAAWAALAHFKDLDCWGDFASWEMRAAFRQAAARARRADLQDSVRAELADVTPYQLRHAFGTLIAGITQDDRATMRLLIHSDIRQTHRYTKATVDPRAAAAIAVVADRLATGTTSTVKSRRRASKPARKKGRKSRMKKRK